MLYNIKSAVFHCDFVEDFIKRLLAPWLPVLALTEHRFRCFALTDILPRLSQLFSQLLDARYDLRLSLAQVLQSALKYYVFRHIYFSNCFNCSTNLT